MTRFKLISLKNRNPQNDVGYLVFIWRYECTKKKFTNAQ